MQAPDAGLCGDGVTLPPARPAPLPHLQAIVVTRDDDGSGADGLPAAPLPPAPACPPPADQAGRRAAPPMLDKGAETRQTTSGRPRLTRAQLRARDQIEARLATWHRHAYAAFFLTLTSAPGSPSARLNRNFEVLRRRLSAHLGIPRPALEYCRVTTREGHGVIHAVIGVPRDCLAHPGRLADANTLRSWWDELHGARQIVVKAIRGGTVDRRKVSGYIVAQYLADQSGAYLRLSQSRCAVDWRASRADFRAQCWPDRWSVVPRRNRLGGGRPPGHPDLLDARSRAWRKWSWRKYRAALRDLLAHGVCVLWGYAYSLAEGGAVTRHQLDALPKQGGSAATA